MCGRFLALSFLAAGVPKYGWTDLLDSLAPNGRATGQFVAKYSKGENPQITTIINNALTAGTPDQVFGLTKQALGIVMNQALDVPIAFSVQVSGYNTSRVGGQVYAQTGVCNAPIMNGIEVKS